MEGVVQEKTQGWIARALSSVAATCKDVIARIGGLITSAISALGKWTNKVPKSEVPPVQVQQAVGATYNLQNVTKTAFSALPPPEQVVKGGVESTTWFSKLAGAIKNFKVPWGEFSLEGAKNRVVLHYNQFKNSTGYNPAKAEGMKWSKPAVDSVRRGMISLRGVAPNIAKLLTGGFKAAINSIRTPLGAASTIGKVAGVGFAAMNWIFYLGLAWSLFKLIVKLVKEVVGELSRMIKHVFGGGAKPADDNTGDSADGEK